MDKLYNPAPYIRKALQDAPNKVEPPTNGALQYNGLDTSKIRAMGLNECCYPPSPKVIKAMQDNLSSVNLYPDAQCPRLSDIISERTGIDNKCIVWGNGSEELLKGAIDLSLSPGQGLVLPVPTFWGYKSMVAAFEADVTEVENLPDGKDTNLGHKALQISGGQRQRIMMARAYLIQPKLIVADEPVSMVDASLRASILDLMLRLKEENGISFLYITHDLSTAYQIGDQIYILYHNQ